MKFTPSLRKQPLFWGCLVLLVLVMVGGMMVTDFISRYGEGRERETLKLLSATAAASFDAEVVRKLRGDPSDIGTQVLAQVRRQLRKIRQANPDVRFVYLMAKRKDQVIFLADVENPLKLKIIRRLDQGRTCRESKNYGFRRFSGLRRFSPASLPSSENRTVCL